MTDSLNQLIILSGRVEKFFKIKFVKRHERIRKLYNFLTNKEKLADKASNEELAKFYFAESEKLVNITEPQYTYCGTSIREVKETLETLRYSTKSKIESLCRQHFSQYLKRARQNKKFTQSDLAKLMGISQSGIAEYEGGRRSPNLSELKRFAQMINLSVEQSIF